MKQSHLKILLPCLGVLLLAVGVSIGWFWGGGLHKSSAQDKLNQIFDLISDQYVDEIDQDSLIELTIPELLQNLDPHSVYIPVTELERVNRELESSFFGIGVQFQILTDSVCVVEVVSGGPAERVGVLPGDRIIEADGKKLTGKDVTNDQVFSTLRGAKDTQVTITVKRSTSHTPIKFTITRGEIPSTTVDAAYLIDGNIGYVRVMKFAGSTHSEFLQAMNGLRVKGATSFIVDLRSNSGGLLDQAILIANEFLPPMSPIVNVSGRIEKDNANWLADGTGIFLNEPVVILTDEFTASSSEIVSGALQDNDRALIVGRRSFGKGLVQRQIALPDSSEIRLTVQRYYTPSGRCIQKDYTRGHNSGYDTEILDRYTNGEIFNVDSVKLDETKIFRTLGGRKVYGGGGIMPDVFVPSDTSCVTSYYLNVVNNGLINKFAYEYADLNRADLSTAKTTSQLLAKLPPADILLRAFTRYAAENGVPQRWYYINISTPLILTQLRALIARDILGMTSYFEIVNETDLTVLEAVKQIRNGLTSTITVGSK